MADFSYQLFIIGTLFGIIEKEKKKKMIFFPFGKEEKWRGKKMWISLLFISFNNYEENGEK